MSQIVIYKENDEFEYSVNKDEVTITRYKGLETDITIPQEIDGKPVTSIGNWVFNNS